MSRSLRPSRLRRAGLLLLCAAAPLGCRSAPLLEEGPRWPRPVRGAVVSEHRLASEVGARILEEGGNAADAAVATALALAVVYPQAGNLGGGGFAVIVPHDGRPEALDFREVAPATATPERYLDESGSVDPARSRRGPLSVGVPGSPAGLFALWESHGSGLFSFHELIAPAERLAREGFEVDAWLERSLRAKAVRERMAGSAAAQRIFYPDGIPLIRGQRLVQRELADTLGRLAARGPRGFYAGATATLLVQEVEHQLLAAGQEGPWITSEDLAAYRPRWREPLVGWFRGHQIITMPPPSSGGIILLQVLSVLAGFPVEAERHAALDELALAGEASAGEPPAGEGPGLGLDDRVLHWWIESLRRSFAGRAEYMGDPDRTEVPVDGLLSSEWVARCRMSIGEEAEPQIQAWVPEPPEEGSQTTHVSVIDRSGNAVSLTTTLNSSFGSGILVEGAGFLLNNELDDFALQDRVPNQFGLVGSEANLIEPGKRPLSSMTPTVVREGGHTVSIVLGSPGGPRIITAVIGVVLRTLLFEQPLAEAVAAPRFHQQWKPERTEFEPGWDPALLEALRTRRGHEVLEKEDTWASVQAIRVRPNGEPVGVSDPRRGGAAVLEGLD